MTVLGPPLDNDAWILGRVFSQDLGHPGRRRCVIGDAELPVLVELSPDRVERLAQIGLRWIEHRQDHRDQGWVLEPLQSPTDGGPPVVIEGVVARHPGGVSRILRKGR